MYAIIKTGGKQYKVSPGERIKIEKIEGEPESEVVFDRVLMIRDEDVKVGKPFVEGAKVIGKIIQQGRGKKIIVFKKKRRKGYHKKQGHRQYFTEVLISEIVIQE